ncbi:hypothetical protein ACQEVF_59570 [Nonomuraea polychroma]|uniref:hypothetical protein n=1 Tax=Nonomuraea polychroma TaxID=46176 RepID=UPI003D8FD4D5
MTTSGAYVRNPQPAAYVADDAFIGNINHSSYAPGTPEVGVFFIAPPSGRVRLTLGGGFRDNSAADRIFLAPQLFREDSDGTEVLAPSVTFRGYLSVAADTEMQYGSRVSMLENLIPGQRYYLRAMHLASPGTDPDTADINSRDIIVIPVP